MHNVPISEEMKHLSISRPKLLHGDNGVSFAKK